MSRQYTNFVKKLQNHNAKIVTSVNDYIADKDTNKYPQFEIECERGHIFTIRVTSLHNKIAHLDKNGGSICAECDKPEICGEEMNTREKCQELGFEFVAYQDRQVYYVCKCGNSTNTHATNLSRQGRQAQCPKCQNKHRYADDDIHMRFEKEGCILLGEYISRYEPVKFKCKCNNIAFISFSQFVDGYRCDDCNIQLICEHDRIKKSCIICTKRACPHNRDKYYCLQCTNNSFCKHNKHKGYCKQCDGRRFCEHNVQRKMCIECDPKKACKTCMAIYAPPKYSPYCTRCFYIMRPEIEIPTMYKLKEHYMRDVLSDNFDVQMIFDKILGGCSLKRPDVFIERYTHGIVIECDEKQHKQYSCENKRIMEIFQDIGNRPLVVIRFNPDAYIDRNNVWHNTCFIPNRSGGFSVKKKEWVRRTTRLINLVNKYINEQPLKEITTYNLFYDNYKF